MAEIFPRIGREDWEQPSGEAFHFIHVTRLPFQECCGSNIIECEKLYNKDHKMETHGEKH